MMITNWGLFAGLIALVLFLDLGVFRRHAHTISIREALVWSAIWISLSLAFNTWIYFELGRPAAVAFLTGYIVEKSLSVDNLFVFIVIFTFFAVPGKLQHRVLFWGIIGALITRGILIALGITLIQRFHWLTYVFGAFLIFTGIKATFSKEKRMEPERNPIIRLLNRILPVSKYYDEGKFFVKEGRHILATPLFVVLLVIEITDVLFALDSIPAILAITLDPFIVYSSNVFAILGLRALFFALAGVMQLFEYLQYGVSMVLVVVGVKMIVGSTFHIPDYVMLMAVGGILLSSIVVSLVKAKLHPES